MRPRVKLWLEGENGLIVLSDYRARLLRLVCESGSLAQAAAAMHLSYRRAWGKIRELEENLGRQLVQSEVGGVGGGKTHLTAEGARLLDAYERFAAEVGASVERIFAGCFEALDVDGSAERVEQAEVVADDAVHTPADEA
jgi:molybdate transport repressor ModE-like protein